MKIKVKDLVTTVTQKFVYIELSEEEAHEIGAELNQASLTGDLAGDSGLDDLLDLLNDNGFVTQ